MAKPTSLQHSKTIHRPIDSFITIDGVVRGLASTNDNITGAITTVLGTASRYGTAVLLQNASDIDTPGLILGEIVLLRDATTKKKIADSGNEEVYGRITEAAGIYTLTYYSLVAGVETGFMIPAGNIDIQFPYRFSFDLLPTDAIINNKSFIDDDVSITNIDGGDA